MDHELMDKEVLCLFDLRQIQRYLFQCNSDLDAVGANHVLQTIFYRAMEYAVKNVKPGLSPNEYAIDCKDVWERIPYFVNPAIQVQLVSDRGGNGIVVFRSGRICQKISRLVSRYFLDNTYSLEIAVCAVEKTDDINADIDAIYRKLDGIKFSAELARPYCPLPIILREKTTGSPVVAQDPELHDFISTETIIRRTAVRQIGNMVKKEEIDFHRTIDEQELLAIGHIDGNNIGISISKILLGAKSYEEGLRFRRVISNNIENAYADVLNELDKLRRAKFEKQNMSPEEMRRQFFVLQYGGDDLNIMCNAKYALEFADAFIKRIREKTYWRSENTDVYFSVCGGFAFITPDIPFHEGYALAEECCASAKKLAKLESNLIDGMPGNWIDFQFCTTLMLQDLDVVRERDFKTDSKTSLMLRPYSFDERQSGGARAYDSFEKRCRFLTSGAVSREQLALLKRSYRQGQKETQSVYKLLKRYGVNFPDSEGPYVRLSDTGEYHAVWYDALECAAWNWNEEVSQ